MIRPDLTSLLCLVFSASIALANTLSPSEQAAAQNRAPTAAERQLRETECAWVKATSRKKVTVPQGVSGRLVALDDLQIVKSLEMKRIKTGASGFSAIAYQLLPNGGIAGKDFCALAQFFTFEQPDRIGAVIAGAGVVLRRGINLKRDYPNTWRAISSGNYLTASAGGAYVVFDLSNSNVKTWWDTSGALWNGRRKNALAISVGDRLFYPVNVD